MPDRVRLKNPHGGPSADHPNVWSEYEIEAKTSFTDRVLRNLKYGDAFAVMDAHGDIGAVSDTAEGLYYRDTRYLSSFELRLEGKRPLLLNSAVHEDKAALSVELTNPDVNCADDRLTRDTIFLQRTKFLLGSRCHERIGIRSFASEPRRLRIDFLFDADFRDDDDIGYGRGVRPAAARIHVRVDPPCLHAADKQRGAHWSCCDSASALRTCWRANERRSDHARWSDVWPLWRIHVHADGAVVSVRGTDRMDRITGPVTGDADFHADCLPRSTRS